MQPPVQQHPLIEERVVRPCLDGHLALGPGLQHARVIGAVAAPAEPAALRRARALEREQWWPEPLRGAPPGAWVAAPERGGNAWARQHASQPRGLTDGAPRRRPASVPMIVIYRREVGPMNEVSAVGAPPQDTTARLR